MTLIESEIVVGNLTLQLRRSLSPLNGAATRWTSIGLSVLRSLRTEERRTPPQLCPIIVTCTESLLRCTRRD